MGIYFNFKKSLLFCAGAICISGCGAVNVSLAPPPVTEYSSLSTFCTLPPKEIGRFTKVLFVVDQSGSNASGPTTDPTKTRRRDAMTNFYNKHSANQFIQWGLISFQAETATQFINNPAFQPAANFPGGLTQFEARADQGGTPYKAAIFEVTKAVSDDLLIADVDVEANYEIIFLSDGVPSDYGNPIVDNDIFTDITRLVKLAEGRIHFSTVYYNVSGAADPAASNRLKEMANVGLGKFLDASNGENINIDELIVGGVSNISYQIKDLFVYNLSSAVCDSGQMGADSDADGLCDTDEDAYNVKYSTQINNRPDYAGKLFNKNNRNSFVKMYSDLFILKNILGELLPTCSAAEASLDPDHDLLNNCEEMFLVNRNPQGPTQTWTSEMLASSKYTSKTNFDSDGDGLMDSLEFFFFREAAAAMDFNSVLKKLFGTSYYDLFKNHLSKVSPGSSSPYNIDVKQVSRNDAGQNCYTFSQENLPMYSVAPSVFSQTGNLDLVHSADENIVLVYYIMTPENDPEGKGVMRYSYQKIKKDKTAKQIDLSSDRFDYVFAK